jgi:uncharacterized protein YbjT (DUF2867 family)
MAAKTILLTGATGFVGSNLWPELERAGYSVRGLTRNPDKARRARPDREWLRGDLNTGEGIPQALAGCDAAFYLAHGMAEGGHDFRQRELDQARRFAQAAGDAGVGRIVYLGGFQPQGEPSEHLASRLEVGEALRSGPVLTVELRASMIVGHGSLSWIMVRDLAARLPAMILPRWLRSRTQPVALDDVLLALVRALELPLQASDWFDLPGPDTLSGKEILIRTAELLGRSRPVLVEVPVLSPWLSSHWVHFVTRAEWSVAREVVIGLAHDFLARDGRYWELIGHRPMSFDEAARRALAAERAAGDDLVGFWGRVERALDARAQRVGKRAA